MSRPLISVSGTIVGAEAFEARLSLFAPAEAMTRIKKEVHTLGFLLEAKVKSEKLNGVVLRRQSGRLARSINTRFSGTATSESSHTGTSVKYGRIWELTGSREFRIFPKNKQALFWKGALHPVRSVLHPAQRPRPFLKPALQELRPTILTRLTKATEGL